MQALGLCGRRLFSTKSPIILPDAARVARTASTPLAVRLRRRKKFGPVAVGASDATPEGLTPSELARYQRLRAKGELTTADGQDVTESDWLQSLNDKRSRIRGIKTMQRDGVEEKKVVGQRVYLPNIIFRLVRNNTPPGQPYNPYEATFRIPNSVTKTDVRSYLLSVYGVKTTYIRTDNYYSPRSKLGMTGKSFKTYKRAVVGLVDPFYYPFRMEDMEIKERKEREKWIEDHFHLGATRALQKYELLRLSKGAEKKRWKWKEPSAIRRSDILRLVAEKRARREGLISDQATLWQQMRERGEPITINKPDAPSPDSIVAN